MNTTEALQALDRRSFLRGVGVTLALPLMDSLASAATLAKPPVRLAFMYMPHGVIMDQFWPTSQETFLNEPHPLFSRCNPSSISAS